jgi:hypothetical protein
MIEGEELDHVVLGGRGRGRAVPFREFRRVARGGHQRLPLLRGSSGQVQHEVEVHFDEPRDVLCALDIATHPVDRFGHAREH